MGKMAIGFTMVAHGMESRHCKCGGTFKKGVRHDIEWIFARLVLRRMCNP